jgi:hypothetical protein
MKPIKTITIKGKKVEEIKELLYSLGMISKGGSTEIGGMKFTRLR